MKQADLVVGNDYALDTTYARTSTPYAARVTVVDAPARGRVDVEVRELGDKPSWMSRSPYRKGQTLQVRTAEIVCPWDEHTARMEARALAEAEVERREAEEREARRPDPSRTVASEYEPRYSWDPLDDEEGPSRLANMLNASLRPYQAVSSAAAVALLGDLPPDARRDLIAALPRQQEQLGAQQSDATAVGAVFRRAAQLAERSLETWTTRTHFPTPDALFRPYDAEFLFSIAEFATSRGQEFRLPFVPRLPGWVTADPHGPTSRMLAALGWVRVALADTDGRKLHRLGCPSTHSGSRLPALREVETLSWWELALNPPSKHCGRCGGPGTMHGAELAHFLAAADVWEATGRARVESWQIAAVGRLLAATSTRMREGEFDVSLSGRVWDALSDGTPGEEGWSGYYVANGLSFKTESLTPEEQSDAVALVVRRLNQLLDVVPGSEDLTTLPGDADATLVAAVYRKVRSRYADRVTELDRVLFSLPDAWIY